MAKKNEILNEPTTEDPKDLAEPSEKTQNEILAKERAQKSKDDAALSAKLQAQEAQRLKDKAAKVERKKQHDYNKLMETPLNENEKAELADLEAKAADGAHPPTAQQMLRLGHLRKRSELD